MQPVLHRIQYIRALRWIPFLQNLFTGVGILLVAYGLPEIVLQLSTGPEDVMGEGDSNTPLLSMLMREMPAFIFLTGVSGFAFIGLGILELFTPASLKAEL